MNSQFKYMLGISMSVVFCTLVWAQPSGYKKHTQQAKFEEELKEVSAELHTIKAEFKQRKNMQFLDAELISGGEFWFKSPGKVRWEYTSPYRYTVIINEGTLNLISDENENEFDMNSSEVFGQINGLMLAAVSGNIFGNSHYNTECFENSSLHLVILTPGNSHISDIIKKMELYFDKETFRVVQMKMIEPNSDFSLITFTNQTVNEIIEDSIFKP